MKLTYLILAHKDPEQLKELLATFDPSNSIFIIHVDLRADLSVFKNSITTENKNVFFLSKRFNSSWGSFNLIEATLEGFKFFIENIEGSNRLTLLSGHDFPIKPSKHINAYFSANQDKIFLTYFDLPFAKWMKGGLHRFPNYQRINNIIKLYGGSQWFSFPASVINYILSFLKHNQAFVEYFKLVKVPDESFFQTLLLNCGEDFVLQNLVNNNLKLIKWDKPFMHPRVLTIGDKRGIRKSKHLFARKFDGRTSSQMMEYIQKHIL